MPTDYERSLFAEMNERLASSDDSVQQVEDRRWLHERLSEAWEREDRLARLIESVREWIAADDGTIADRQGAREALHEAWEAIAGTPRWHGSEAEDLMALGDGT